MSNEYAGIHFFWAVREAVKDSLQPTSNVHFINIFFLLLALPNLQQQLSVWQADDLP